MLDIKKIREDYEGVLKAVESRTHGDFGLPDVRTLDEERRALLAEVEQLKSKQNAASKEIPRLKKEGKDASELLDEMKKLSDEIKEKDAVVTGVEEK
jgi:seryl-tRNA synthetase